MTLRAALRTTLALFALSVLPAAAQTVTPPGGAVFGIGAGATPTSASVVMTMPNGTKIPIGVLNPTSGVFSPSGLGSEAARAQAAEALAAAKANNLSDLASPGAARTNLGAAAQADLATEASRAQAAEALAVPRGGDVSTNTVTANGSAGSTTLAYFASQAVAALPNTGGTMMGALSIASNANLASQVGGLGARGPLFVWTDPAQGSLAAGQSADFQYWMGQNPTATPAAGDNVVGTIGVNNGNGRSRMYGLDLLGGVCSATTCGAGFNDSFLTLVELESFNGYPMTESNPWGGGAYRKNGIEMTARAGSAGRLTSALETWANDNSGTGWWNTGIALSRVGATGILAQANPNGITTGSGALNADAVNAFSNAFIDDESNSGAVLKLGTNNGGGTHTSVVDLSAGPTFPYFVRGFGTADTYLPFKNTANYNMFVVLDSGNSATQRSDLIFDDQAAQKWIFGKDATNTLRAYSVASGHTSLAVNPTTDALSTYGDVQAGAGTNNTFTGRAVTVNATAGQAGLLLQTNGAARAALITDGSSYAQLATVGNIPVLLAVNNVAMVNVGATQTTISNAAQFKGHVLAGPNAPALTSCGTSPTISGSDNAGLITTGTGATACTLTFATSYANRPYCTVTGESAAVTYAVTKAAITIAAGAGVNVDYQCTGQAGG